ncbi:hypothetical protein [Marinomonas transparens]|uniref:Uncharacterized protein n=1 Tax=Marinomonas transparens TaxID=2795388 RepID=A0A934JY06_9GAMM|nr:hypothetical protein [Marinomonas transparens]MBJ7539269.1 hypothetical protein [Marinomonas transparens]
MEENGTFTALLTINLGVLGLIITYLIATEFFFSEKKTETKIKIKSLLNEIKPTYKTNEYLNIEKVRDSFSKIEGALQCIFLIKNKGKYKAEELTPHIDLIKSNYFNAYADSTSILAGSSFIKSERINNKDTSNLRKELLEYKYIFEEIIHYDSRLDPHTGKTISESISEFLDEKNLRILTLLKTALTNSVNSTPKKLEAINRVIQYTNEIDSIIDHHNNSYIFKEKLIRQLFLISISGIILPSFFISLLPYETYITGLTYDLSITASNILLIFTFIPYSIISSDIYRKFKNERHTTDTPST